LLLVWFLTGPRTPDLAAAAYRLNLFEHLGMAVYDEHWYAGHDLPGYSVLFPPLAWLLGLRVVGALSVLLSVFCFERLTRAAYGERSARWAAAAFAIATVSDVWIGRLAFALGVSLALAAALVYSRLRPDAGWRAAPAVALAVLCAAASPVAGLFLALAALSDALWRRSPRALLVLAAPAVIVVLALRLLFPEGGTEPFPILSFAATAAVVLAFLWGLPREQSLLRLGAALYLLASLAFLALDTPMGSNIERYGVLLAGPLLAGAVLSGRGRVTLGAILALAAWAVWTGWGPVRETAAVAGDPSTGSAYYAPVVRLLDEHPNAPVRIEVPLTRSHWETAELAPRISLARGWEKQLDTRFDAPLLDPGLTAAGYERWLRTQAVSYVALPDAKLDPSSAREGELIAAGLPYLREVSSSRHWRIYAVRSPTPILSGPGRLTLLGHESFALHARAAGSFLVRVHYTRYWSVSAGSGCVGRAPGDWTRVVARAPGEITVRAGFSLSRAIGAGPACHLG
jgi:MFS family permease